MTNQYILFKLIKVRNILGIDFYTSTISIKDIKEIGKVPVYKAWKPLTEGYQRDEKQSRIDQIRDRVLSHPDSVDTLVDAQDLDVYIIYGKENSTYDDDQKTSHDGSFEFKYLNPGDYEIFVYSECMFCPQGQDSLILKSVKISNANEVNELDTIHVANFI